MMVEELGQMVNKPAARDDSRRLARSATHRGLLIGCDCHGFANRPICRDKFACGMAHGTTSVIVVLAVRSMGLQSYRSHRGAPVLLAARVLAAFRSACLG